jgi:drug/metabolite transporter (DMT)-like permease
MPQSIDDWNRQGNCFRAPITKQERERFRLGLLILIAGLIGILVAVGLFLQSQYSSSYLAGAILMALMSSAPILSGLYRMFRHSWWIEYNP